MNFPFFIAKRLRLSGRSGGKAPSVPVAITGVSLSLAVMLLSVAIVVGFKREITEKVRGFDADLKVSAARYLSSEDQIAYQDVDTALQAFVANTLPEANVALTASTQGVLKTSDNFAGIVLTGYDNHHDWDFIRSHIVDGKLPDYSNPSSAKEIVLSASVANQLGLTAGEKVDTYFFANNNIRARKYTIAAIYDTHFNDYDTHQCFASLDEVRRLTGLDEKSAQLVEIRGVDNDNISEAATKLDAALYKRYLQQLSTGEGATAYQIDDTSRTGALYYNWLDLLDTNVVVILILMGSVAAFTLVSCLFTIVLERVNMIGAMKAMGATNAQITHTFMWLASRIVAIGLVIGNIIGLGIALAQSTWRLIPLDPETYYLTSVPIYINWIQLAAINLGIIALSALILLVPSRMIAGVSPATSIRYE